MTEPLFSAVISPEDENDSTRATSSRSMADKQENSKTSTSKTNTSGKKKSSKSTRKSSRSEEKCEDDLDSRTSTSSGMSVNLEHELRAEISSVKESVGSITARMDLFLPLVQKLVSDKSVTSGGQQETDREIATSGGQQVSQSPTRTTTNLTENASTSHENDDAVSLQLSRDERTALDKDIDSDNESVGTSCSGRDYHNRFQKYSLLEKDLTKSINNSEKDTSENNILQNIFGDDVKTKPDKDVGGIVLDQSQIDILNLSWRCDTPLSLTAYKDEYKMSFPVSAKSSESLDLPKLDDITQSLLCKRHGPKAGKSKFNKLYSQPEKTFENISFKGQAAARMGLVITAYLQQALGTLMTKLNETEPNLDLVIQMVKDIFAMSVKSFDQTARAGAFHHLIRRKATLIDTGLESISELSDKFMNLKLSSDGVLGKDFEEKLKSRSETNKQIKDLLPELNQKSSSSTNLKRKPSSGPSQDVIPPKVPRNDFSNFRIPKINNSKQTEGKGGFKSSFRRTPGGKQDQENGKKGSFRDFNRSK